MSDSPIDRETASDVAAFLRACGIEKIAEFKTCAMYCAGMDWLIYLEKDCSYRAHFIPGSSIELLYDAYSDEIVGIKIKNFSEMVPSSVIEALRV